jgi:hypothetical protein
MPFVRRAPQLTQIQQSDSQTIPIPPDRTLTVRPITGAPPNSILVTINIVLAKLFFFSNFKKKKIKILYSYIQGIVSTELGYTISTGEPTQKAQPPEHERLAERARVGQPATYLTR